MADIEKVKLGIKNCTDKKNKNPCESCEYRRKQGCTSYWMKDALSVIESQQAEIERLKENIDTLLPVLHGEWEEKEYSIGKCYAICSLCKKSSMGYAKDTGFGFEYSFPNYCPHCGAKMKQEGR